MRLQSRGDPGPLHLLVTCCARHDLVTPLQVRGGAKKLVIDLGVVLEGQHAWELPEVLLGAVRWDRDLCDTLKHIDCGCTRRALQFHGR